MNRGRVITIGTFDGVHRGHQQLLARAVGEARNRKMKSRAVAFRIPPRMVLEHRKKFSLLSTPEEKERLFKRFGIDEVTFLTFDHRLASIRPFTFFRDVLMRRMRAKGLVVGADFRFGQNRSAGALELVRWGQEFNIPVWVVAPVKWRRTVVSSSLLRGLFEANNLKSAVDYLGHGYMVEGKVVRGRRLGRKLGFPTANLAVGPEKVLPRGVFAVRGGLSRGSGEVWAGVCNIGIRPTVAKRGDLSVEVHFLDVRPRLEGKRVWIELLHRLRGEKRFPGIQALKAAIQTDIRAARRRLSAGSPLYTPCEID